MLHLLCSTAIPDEAVLGILGAMITTGAASIKYLWNRVNRLQMQVAKLTVQLEIYRNCGVRECPARVAVERADLKEFREVTP